jgi:hypothetical protein
MSAQRINLSGQWTVRLDRERQGLDEEWFRQPIDGQSVCLPGALRDSGIGDEVGPDTDWIGGAGEDVNAPRYAPYRGPDSFKMPHWLQPEFHYVGVAWYERIVSVPKEWGDSRVVLSLERPHWQTTVWVDGIQVETGESLSVPHEHDLTEVISPGETRITIRVDNSLTPVDVGENSHSVSDHTQSAWHGMVGNLSLRSPPDPRIDDVQVYPDATARTADVSVDVATHGEEVDEATLNFEVTHEGDTLLSERQEVTLVPDGVAVESLLNFAGTVPLWDEFDPSLCELEVTLRTPDTEVRESVRFGFRDVGTKGSQITVNGRRVLLRGTLECCIFPDTGYPPMDAESWRDVLQTVTEHGLNHVRFHSWCPPEAAFEAADELGVYLQVECSSWANQSTALGEGKAIDDWLYEEGERILKAYGNHPSFLLFAYGNEPGGNDADYLADWVDTFKERTDRQLVTGGSGWPLIDENEFHVPPDPRLHAWGEGLDDRLNANQPATRADHREFIEQYPDTPTIAHEIGQWCAYPNLDETKKYTGALEAKNFEIFRDFLEDAGMSDRAHEFLLASGQLQELCYKEEIETALRTPEMGGFQLLQLHDFPGQGTAPVGVLDAFFDSKPYHDPDRFARYAGPVVPLARLDRRTFTPDDSVSAQIDVSQFGPEDLTDPTIDWRLDTADGEVVEQGSLKPMTLPTGELHEVGAIRAPLDGVSPPQKITLSVSVPGADAHNSWDLWVYPTNVNTAAPSGVTVATAFDRDVRHRLRDGDDVALFADPDTVTTNVSFGFTSIFWNTAWTDNQPPHTLGICCDPDHPALAGFPTSGYTNWQWWDLVSNAEVLELDTLSPDVQPVVQVVPDWFDPQKFGLVFEAQVFEGNLLVTSIDLQSDLAERPVARQFRQSILDYVVSDEFAPRQTVSADKIESLFE